MKPFEKLSYESRGLRFYIILNKEDSLPIIEILKKRSISYGELLATLKCDNSELAKVISEMEDVDIIKIGKLYNLIDNTVFSRGTVVIRNGNPYLKTSEESIYIVLLPFR